MPISKYNIIATSLAVIAILVASLAISKCNERGKITYSKEVVEKVNKDSIETQRKLDLAESRVREADSNKNIINHKLDIVKGQLQETKKAVIDLALKVKAAREIKDTATLFSACDSLAEINLILIGVIASYEEYADTLTKIAAMQLAEKDSMIIEQAKLYQKIKKDFLAQSADQQKIELAFKKEKGKQFNVSISAGYGIGKDLKPSPYVGITVGKKIFSF